MPSTRPLVTLVAGCALLGALGLVALPAAGAVGPTTATVVPAASAAPVTAAATVLDSVWPDYDAARRALANDRLGELARPAKQLQRTIAGVDAASLTADRAGVPADGLAKVRELLPDLRRAAQAFAEASSLPDARKAFGDLSKGLVAWRKLAAGGPDVGFCPMLGKEWLQAGKTPVENPYGGRAMATCGDVAPPR